MRKMRRGLSLVMASVMAASLAGCSGGGKTETSAAATETKAAETTAEAGTTQGAEDNQEEITLRFVSWQTNHDAGNQKVAEAYKKLHPNVTVQFDYVGDMNSSDYLTKTDIMLMGGEPIDILMTANYAQYTVRAMSGSYLPLDDFMKEEGITAEDAYNVILKVNDQTYGIPGEMKYNLVLINKNMLDEAGLEVPALDWTWDDYHEYAKKLTSGSGADTKYGSYFHSWDHYNYMGMWSNYPDNPMFNADMTAVNFDHPMFKEWLQFRYDMENEDKCQVPYADVKSMNMNYRDKFFNGQIAMLPIGSFMIPELDDQDKYPHEFVTTFAPIPAWEDAEPGTTYTESHFYSISKTSKHPQEAYDYIRFYTTEGMRIRGISVSAEKGIDKMEFVNMQIEDPKYVDVEALKNVINNPAWKDNLYANVPSYNKELAAMMTDESAKFLLGTESLDNVIDSMMKNGTQMMKDKAGK